ncbi:hypothetical protein BFL38_04955 [Brachyspira hampsonii]|uniref:DUF2589 domain-containing protein n=1 Tax=Brachyspira hampsonii TaxID=1287055 RepID=A0A1E5ND53_9SPIR|nr:DUF2589 domain-containing protein [Brachyspira hampsonii]OEJ14084.1 hypothetical protein BFL38_04955 [Brachyspira hampsonii]
MTKFNEVITAIAKSVAEAEAQLEETQLANLSKYFKKKENKYSKNNNDEYLSGVFPIRLKIGIPDENNQYGNKYYCVPYINLLPITQLNIDSITASFDIGVLELVKSEKPNDKSSFNNLHEDDVVESLSSFNSCPDVSVDIKNTAMNDKGTNIHIHISIKKTENSEGMSKLMNEIANSNQGFIMMKDNKK